MTIGTRDERKLTTILAADVAGYARLMGEDESATLAQLKASRQLFADEVARRRGQIVNTAGDGLLAEFASVVEAVDCAVQVQRGLKERNAALPEGRRMHFRIGINLGDVLVDGSDLLGDGVNVAARLQSLADPGGILISGTVFDQVKDKLALGFDYLGPQAVKNIPAEVPAYRVLLEPGSGSARTAPREIAPGRPALWRWLASHTGMGIELIVLFFLIDLLSDGRLNWFWWPSLGVGFWMWRSAIGRPFWRFGRR